MSLALLLLALCRSLLQSEDDVHDTHQDQFRQFQQQAHAIVQELQELEGATWYAHRTVPHDDICQPLGCSSALRTVLYLSALGRNPWGKGGL